MSAGKILRVSLRPSALLASLLILVHVLALGALTVSLEGLPLALSAAGVVFSALGTAGEALQRWRDSPMAIELRDDGRAAWRDRGEQWHETGLAPGGYVSPWLVILPLEGSGGRRKWLVIGPDAAPGEDLRRLRAWLRWRGGKKDPDGE